MNIFYEQSYTRAKKTFEAPCIAIVNNYMNDAYKCKAGFGTNNTLLNYGDLNLCL